MEVPQMNTDETKTDTQSPSNVSAPEPDKFSIPHPRFTFKKPDALIVGNVVFVLIALIVGVIVSLPKKTSQNPVTKAVSPSSTQLVVQFSQNPTTGAISVDQVIGVNGVPPNTTTAATATAALSQEVAQATVSSVPLTFTDTLYTDDFEATNSPLGYRVTLAKPQAWAVIPYSQGSLYKIKRSGQSQTTVIDPTAVSNAVKNLYVSKATTRSVNLQPTTNVKGVSTGDTGSVYAPTCLYTCVPNWTECSDAGGKQVGTQTCANNYKCCNILTPTPTRTPTPTPVPRMLNILVEGAGYSSDSVFDSDAIILMRNFVSTVPFNEYYARGQIQFWLDNTSSRLGCNITNYYTLIPYNHIQTVECDPSAMTSEAVSSGYPFNVVITIYQSSVFGGSARIGSNLAQLTSTAIEQESLVFPHEFGHAFGSLDDEYDLKKSYDGSPLGANCDSQSTCPKWKGLAGTGCYSICGFSNLYRPSTKNIMAANGNDYDPVSLNAIRAKLNAFFNQ